MISALVSRPLAVAAAAGLTLALSACAASGPSSCAGTDASGSMPFNPNYHAVSAAAVSLEDGLGYTIFLADYPTDPEDVSVFGFEPAPVGNGHAILAITAYEAPSDLAKVAAGDTIEFTEEYGVRTFSLLGEDPEQVLYGNYTAAVGKVVVTALDEQRICGTIEYTDEEKSLSGTFEAPIALRF